MPCKYGHVGERYVNNSGCVVCARLRAVAWAENNRERQNINARRYAEKNRKEVNNRIKNWKKENTGKVNSYTAARRAQKLQAQPRWANTKEIQKIYTQAKRLSGLIGITYHVDHIIPLQHPTVCGLHIPHNLQIIPAQENLIKQNTYNVF